MDKTLKNFSKIMPKICYFSALILIIATGIYFRVLFFSYNRPFWNDEAALALNILNGNFLDFFNPLKYLQASPPIFLILTKFITSQKPYFEAGYRIIPLISSILSIFVFYFLSTKILKSKLQVILSVGIFSFLYQFCYYGQEFKQYSLDVLIFLSILLSGFFIDINKISVKKAISISTLYGFYLWLSFTSVFAVAVVFSTCLINNFRNFKKTFYFILPFLIIFILFYFNQSYLNTSADLHSYWKEGFLNYNFSNFFNLLNINLKFFLGNVSYVFIFAILTYIGFFKTCFEYKEKTSQILLFAVFFAFLVSYLHIYPLFGRTSLYFYPILILFIAKSTDIFNSKPKIKMTANIFLMCMIFLFVLQPLNHFVGLKNYSREDVVVPLLNAFKIMQPEDVLYITADSSLSYKFYAEKYKFSPQNIIFEDGRTADINEYMKKINNLKKGVKYFYIFSHFPDKKGRLEGLYENLKIKKDFKFYSDKSLNALIIFSN